MDGWWNFGHAQIGLSEDKGRLAGQTRAVLISFRFPVCLLHSGSQRRLGILPCGEGRRSFWPWEWGADMRMPGSFFDLDYIFIHHKSTD